MTKEEAEVILRNEWDLLKKSGLLSQIGCSSGQLKQKEYIIYLNGKL